MSEQSGADPMNEQTPADALEVVLEMLAVAEDSVEPLRDVAASILDALDAAGFLVSSKPDDDTVAALVELAQECQSEAEYIAQRVKGMGETVTLLTRAGVRLAAVAALLGEERSDG